MEGEEWKVEEWMGGGEEAGGVYGGVEGEEGGGVDGEGGVEGGGVYGGRRGGWGVSGLSAHLGRRANRR